MRYLLLPGFILPSFWHSEVLAIGLGPIEEHLKKTFNFEWNLEEQIRRTREFVAKKKE